MLVSLLQPQPEVFDLFDDIWCVVVGVWGVCVLGFWPGLDSLIALSRSANCLTVCTTQPPTHPLTPPTHQHLEPHPTPPRRVISSGKLVFQGPRDFVLPFFSSLGFACPRMKGTADFLQEVNTYTDQEVCSRRDGVGWSAVDAQCRGCLWCLAGWVGACEGVWGFGPEEQVCLWRAVCFCFVVGGLRRAFEEYEAKGGERACSCPYTTPINYPTNSCTLHTNHPNSPVHPYTRTPTAPAHTCVHPPHPLQRFWEGPLDEYRYVPAHEIADAYYRTEPGAAIMRELEAPPEELEKGGHSELATNR